MTFVEIPCRALHGRSRGFAAPAEVQGVCDRSGPSVGPSHAKSTNACVCTVFVRGNDVRMRAAAYILLIVTSLDRDAGRRSCVSDVRWRKSCRRQSRLRLRQGRHKEMRATSIGIVALLCVPAVATHAAPPLTAYPSAYPTTQEILWPALGRYPGYPAEPDERPVRFSLSGGVYHDSNPFRLSDSVNPQTVLGTSSKSDTFYRLGAGVTGDIPISRQHLLFEAAMDGFRYDRFDLLDNVAYRAGVAWKWEAGSEWSGDVGYTRRHFLSPLEYLQQPVKDMITDDHIYANGGYRLTPRWRVRGTADWIQSDHSNDIQASLDNHTAFGIVGLDYLTPAGNSIGAQVKFSRGIYPNDQLVAGTLVNNDYDEVELSAVAQWIVTGKSTLYARLGYTDRSQDQLPERDFQGVTGRVDWDWTPTGKTLINFAAWHEIHSYQDVTASYVVSNGASLGPNWALTSKVVLQARLLYEERKFKGDPGLVLGTTGPEREDKFRGGRISVGYTPWRNFELSLAAEAGKRTSNTAGNDFDFTSVSANAQFSF